MDSIIENGLNTTYRARESVENASKDLDIYYQILGPVGKKEDKQRDQHDVEWNNYSYKKYQSQTRVLFVINITCFIIILLSLSRSDFFDETAYLVSCGVVLGIAFIIIGRMLWDISVRDNINFDEYNFGIYGTKPMTNIDISFNVDVSFNTDFDISFCNTKGSTLYKQLFSS
jgi:hypothetical protein